MWVWGGYVCVGLRVCVCVLGCLFVCVFVCVRVRVFVQIVYVCVCLNIIYIFIYLSSIYLASEISIYTYIFLSIDVYRYSDRYISLSI